MADLVADLKNSKSYFLPQNQTLNGAIIFCIVVGVISFAGGFFTVGSERTWGSFLFNLFYFFSLALGGTAFAAMQDTIGAQWARPIKRIHEAFSSFLPIAAILFIILFISIATGFGGAQKLYRWIVDPAMLEHYHGKDHWLQKGWMIGRDIFSLAVILGLWAWQMCLTTKRDRIAVNGQYDAAVQEGKRVQEKLRYWSGPILVCYAFAFSLLTFDVMKSLAPKWFSTLWAGWMFAIMMQTLMAVLLITMFIFRDSKIGAYIKRPQFHDVGKLMHGFTIFFAYLTYAHILTYWYTNIPEETLYFFTRMQNPWRIFVIIVPILAFAIPLFVLIPKASKWTPAVTLPICGIILFAQWLSMLLIVMPEVIEPKNWGLPWVEIGMFLGMLGLFLASFRYFTSRNPLLSVADPLLIAYLHNDEH